MVGILDLNLGNLRSVYNAVYNLGFDAAYIKAPEDIMSADRIILPGVGNFSAAMAYIRENGFEEAIQAFANTGRPVLGICLGMQLLAGVGEEGGDIAGLNLIRGSIRKLSPEASCRLPHIGWNNVEFVSKHPVFNGVRNNSDFYFVHSFAYCDAGDSAVIGVTEYGGERFGSVIAAANIIGFQFHPEKSQVHGLKLLDNYCGWSGKC